MLDESENRALVPYEGWSEKWDEWISRSSTEIELPESENPLIRSTGDHHSFQTSRDVTEIVVDGKLYKCSSLKDGRSVFLDPSTGNLLWHIPRKLSHRPDIKPKTENPIPSPKSLPEGWLYREDPHSKTPYYFNTINWKAQWDEPRLLASVVAENIKTTLSTIPHPWEEYFDIDGNPHYHNPDTNKTVWEIPLSRKVGTKTQPVQDSVRQSVTEHQDSMDQEKLQLPEGWQVYFTDDGEPYYYCVATDKSYWEIPDGVGSDSIDDSEGGGDIICESQNPFDDVAPSAAKRIASNS